MNDDRAEVFLGDHALILDGRVVEVLHRTGVGDRFHVNHVAVEASRVATAACGSTSASTPDPEYG